jgi:hypothetical protein
MVWGSNNNVVPTPDETRAIAGMMGAFPGIRHQIGGANPCGGCYNLPADAVVVWADLAFFVLYRIHDSSDRRSIFLDGARALRTMHLPTGRRAVFFPIR